MFSIPQTSLKAERFHSYVEELRQFASTYGMHCGDPGDLHVFVASLDADEAFRDECSSMLRSIVYRERGKAPPSELLTLVTTAWGGPDIADAAEGLQEPIRHILRFVSGVMHGSRESASPSRDVAPFITEPAEHVEAISTTPARTVGIAARLTTVLEGVRPLPHVADVDVEIASLEQESDDVIRYRKLLRQRASADEMPSQVPVEQPLPSVAFQSKLLSASAVDLSVSAEEAAPADDPWHEDSELQRELRRFAAERNALQKAQRAAMEARSVQARLLRKAEAVLCRFVGADNVLRRSLDRRSL